MNSLYETGKPLPACIIFELDYLLTLPVIKRNCLNYMRAKVHARLLVK